MLPYCLTTDGVARNTSLILHPCLLEAYTLKDQSVNYALLAVMTNAAWHFLKRYMGKLGFGACCRVHAHPLTTTLDEMAAHTKASGVGKRQARLIWGIVTARLSRCAGNKRVRKQAVAYFYGDTSWIFRRVHICISGVHLL